MTAEEARNLLPGDLVDFACANGEYDEGFVKEVRTNKHLTFAMIRSTTPGYGVELVSARRIIGRVRASIAKPTPTIRECRAMTRGYVP